MATKHVITLGFGFANGTKFIPTLGFGASASAPVVPPALVGAGNLLGRKQPKYDYPDLRPKEKGQPEDLGYLMQHFGEP